MSQWTRRAVGLLMIVAMAGTPAAMVACAALCLPDLPHNVSMAMAGGAQHHASMPQAATAPTTDAMPASDSHHHQKLADNSAPPRVTAGVQTVAPTASDRSCCSDASPALIASISAGRADGVVLLAPAVVIETRLSADLPVRNQRVRSPLPQPPTPTRAPFVLRL